MWSYNGKRKFSIGGRRMQSGYIVICKSSKLESVKDQVEISILGLNNRTHSHPPAFQTGQVHGKCFYKFFRDELTNYDVGTKLIITGFAYMPDRGGFQFNSRSCNHRTSDGMYEAPSDIQDAIEEAVENYWNNGQQVVNTSCLIS